jgi:uncharacterized membrane protein
MNAWLLAGTTFFASTVEMVEAATIVLAVGFTQGWRASLVGAASAALALGAIVAIAGPILATQRALHWIEWIVGPFLIYFGGSWLRKVILRFSGRKAHHDERAIYAKTMAALRERSDARLGFVTSFQGVFIEGLEVVIIVVTFTAAAPDAIPYAVGGAILAGIVVAVAAFALRAPLERVPENALKAIVGVMLFSLGIFWTGEAVGIPWWGGDASLLGLIVAVALGVAAGSAILRTARERA